MGKTDKQKEKEKTKGAQKAAGKDKVKKVPKALKPGGGAAKKKKWSASKSKDKLNLAVYWTKPVYDKLIKDIIAKEAFITPSKVSDKLKVNVSCAREALRELLANEVIAPAGEYSSKYCCFVKGPKFVAQEKPKKEGAKGGEGKDKKEKKDKAPKEKAPKEKKGKK